MSRQTENCCVVLLATAVPRVARVARARSRKEAAKRPSRQAVPVAEARNRAEAGRSGRCTRSQFHLQLIRFLLQISVSAHGRRACSDQRKWLVRSPTVTATGYGLRGYYAYALRSTDGAVRAAPTSLDACNELGSHQLPNTVLINFLQHASEHVAGMFADADRQQERTSIWRSLADHLDKRSCVHLKVLVIAAAHEHTGGVRAVCGIKRVVSLCGDLQKA